MTGQWSRALAARAALARAVQTLDEETAQSVSERAQVAEQRRLHAEPVLAAEIRPGIARQNLRKLLDDRPYPFYPARGLICLTLSRELLKLPPMTVPHGDKKARRLPCPLKPPRA